MDENNDTPLMDFFADNESEVPEVGGEAIEKIMDNGGKNLQVRVATNNDNLNDNVNISGIGNTPNEQFSDAVNKAQESGMDTDNVNYVVNIDNNGNLVKNESRIYTKKQLIEARLKNIRENSNTYTKKELYESFLGDLSAQQVKNITGIEDDDNLNSSISAEEREELLANICKDISLTDKAPNIYKGTFKFKTIIDILEKYGFYYMGPYEEDESYNFSDGENEIIIWPEIFYPSPGAINIHNINISEVGAPLNENKSNINEANYNLKRKYINYLYNGLKNLTNKMYKDDDWGAVKYLYNTLQEMMSGKGEVEMWVENGGYWKQLGEFPNYKEYKIKVITNEGIEINGSLKCHAAGTIEDTFKYYDITCTFY